MWSSKLTTCSSLSYAITHLPIKPQNLIARIGRANTPSIRLFESLGFGVAKVVEVWAEVEMRWGWTGSPAHGSEAETEADMQMLSGGEVSGEDDGVNRGVQGASDTRLSSLGGDIRAGWTWSIPDGRIGVYDDDPTAST
jgi:hypothetical protein